MNKYQFTALILGSSVAVAGSALAGAGGDCGDEAGAQAGRGGARFAQIDTDQNGKISLAELTASREGWLTKVDTNKDGVASQAEIDAAFVAGRKQHQQERFAREDVNKDGRLTRDESHMPSAWFERADTNDDGALTLVELSTARDKAIAEKKAEKGDKQAGRAAGPGGKHRGFDANGDGKVEREELRSAAASQFTRLDKNNDGSLTQDEFRLRGHGKHRRGGAPRDGQTTAPAPVRS